MTIKHVNTFKQIASRSHENDLQVKPRLIIDGRYGPATKRAVKTFQAFAGLIRDGIAGPVTEAAIKLRLDRLR